MIDGADVLVLVALTFTTYTRTSTCICYHITNNYYLEPSKLEGCWSAHPRCARVVSQLVVERQHRRSVSCIVIALADCLVTGGVSGHYNVTCSSLILFLFYKIIIL